MQVAKPGFRLRSVYDVAFSPDGQWLVTVGKKSVVTLWDVREGRAVAKRELLKHPNYLDFCPDGASVVVKNTGGTIAVCPVPLDGGFGRICGAPLSEGCRACFSADGQFVIDGSWAGRLVMRRVADCEEVQTEQFADAMVVDASNSADRDLWAFTIRVKHGHPAFGGAGDFVTVRRWPPVGQPSLVQLGPWKRVELAQLNPKGTRVTAVVDWGLVVIDLDAPGRMTTVPVQCPVANRTLAWSPDERLLVTSQDWGYTIRRADDWTVIATIEEKYPAGAAFSPDGQWLALGSWKEGAVMPIAQLI
jgi:WD40 repeat protein